MQPMRESRDGDGNLGARVVAAVVIALLVGGLLLMIAIGAAPLDDPDFDRPPLPEESRHRPEAFPLALTAATRKPASTAGFFVVLGPLEAWYGPRPSGRAA